VRDDFISNLSRIPQLTGALCYRFYVQLGHSSLLPEPGFPDPIYVETYVKMHGFDIMLGWLTFCVLQMSPDSPSCLSLSDVLLVNQTSNTLQNLCLDFATLLNSLRCIRLPLRPCSAGIIISDYCQIIEKMHTLRDSVRFSNPQLCRTCADQNFRYCCLLASKIIICQGLCHVIMNCVEFFCCIFMDYLLVYKLYTCLRATTPFLPRE
jgi:hypothetical protein